jgi:tetratricopeptide (TPR) repeat protein
MSGSQPRAPAGFDEAHSLFNEALAIFCEIGADPNVLETKIRTAECLVIEGRHKEALAILRPLLAEPGPSRAALERLTGIAIVQSGSKAAKARPYFEASLESARTAHDRYELALTLRAIAETNGETSDEADAILEHLGVIAIPRIPLP